MELSVGKLLAVMMRMTQHSMGSKMILDPNSHQKNLEDIQHHELSKILAIKVTGDGLSDILNMNN